MPVPGWETVVLNDILDWMVLIEIFRASNLKTAGDIYIYIYVYIYTYIYTYIYISIVHKTFFRIDKMLFHKLSLNKFNKIAIISSIFSDHNGMKLENNYKKTKLKIIQTCTWKLNNMSVNNKWINNEIKEEIKRYL